MSDTRKKLFGLFRSRSSAENREDRRDGQRDGLQDLERINKRPDRTNQRPDRSRPSRSPQRRPERSNSPLEDPRRSSTRHHSLPSLTPLTLTSWPPQGYKPDGSISQGRALALIATGAPIFKGCRRAVPHTENEHFAFYASADGNGWTGDDRMEPFTAAFSAHSFRLQGPGPSAFPWESLEQPSMSFCYGARPGTCTLNHWVSLSGKPNAYIELRDPNITPREAKLGTILERLVDLEDEFEEDREDVLYKILYRTLLEDPDKRRKPHKPMEKQIADLIVVLSRKEWIDFSRPENQVVAKFFSNAAYTDDGRYKLFFHQLLLSMELDLRISSRKHQEWAKEKLLAQLPPRIAWDLALARKWRECMSIKRYAAGGDPEQIKFHLKTKKTQVKALRRFARAMKWPNLANVDSVLKERTDAKPLEERSSDSMSYFTGIILPGDTLPFLAMNSLIDCDDDPGASALTALTHMHPNCGFQYRSTTYWSATCIVGKVLAPTCHEICGWIGPCRPAPDLSRAQIARIRQRKPKQSLKGSDVESMTVRSDPLGPPSDVYPLSEYNLPLPSSTPVIDTIRIEKIALKPYPPDSSTGLYDAAIQFAIDGRSWPLRLIYNVSFLSAFPCVSGPHPLFFDYVYSTASVEDILSIRSWGSAGARTSAPASMDARAPSASTTSSKEEDDLKEKVLVIEAFGVRDNEVLARAWCAHWGLGAVVAETGRTCVACAIREAYAGCLNVVILVDGRGEGEGSGSGGYES